MKLCIPYRYLIVLGASFGLANIACQRTAFVLVVTHTTRQITEASTTTIYEGCTVFNTSRDYISDYPQDVNMQFHTAFFVGMLIGILSGGHISTIFRSENVITWGIFLASLLSFLIPVVFKANAIGIFVIRFLQGLLEGPVHPALTKLVINWALKHDKSTLMSIAFIGIYFSPAIGNVLVGACLCYISWDSAIYLTAAVGVLWSGAWTFISFTTPRDCPYLSEDESTLHLKEGWGDVMKSKILVKQIPWKDILLSKPVWAIWLASFCKNFVQATIVTLQPQFFKDVFGMRAADIGVLFFVPFVVNSAFIFVFSFIADKLVRAEIFSQTVVRKIMQCTGAMIEAVFFMCMVYAENWQLSFTFLTLAYTFGGMTFSGFSCNIVDLSPQYSAVVSAVVMSGIIGSATSTFTAALVPGRNSTADNWAVIFWLEAAIAASASIVYFFFASGERQSWDYCEEEIIIKSDKEGDRSQLLQEGNHKESFGSICTDKATSSYASSAPAKHSSILASHF